MSGDWRGAMNITCNFVLVGTLEGKRPLGRPRRRWEDIRMDLREVGEAWGESAQDRERWRALVNAVKNFRVLD
jgi:hypothetical protein